MLPALTSQGWLPPGRHPATLAEVEEMFVQSAPFRRERDILWRGALLHLDLVRTRIGRCAAWINGGFVTHKASAPGDVDIVYIAPTAAIEAAFQSDAAGLLQLLTLQDLIVGSPSAGWLKRLQPVGGQVDAFVAPAEVPEGLAYWDRIWSHVKGMDGNLVPGASKGYVEVILP